MEQKRDKNHAFRTVKLKRMLLEDVNSGNYTVENLMVKWKVSKRTIYNKITEFKKLGVYRLAKL